jgi:uncharacterized protein YraI
MPDVPNVQAGQEIAFIAETERQDVRFRWNAINGTLMPTEGSAVIYTAPITEGVDIITLEAINDSGTTVNAKHVSFNIVAHPTDTLTSMPGPAIPDAVVAAHVNLRGGPGTEYARIGVLSPGQVLTVTARLANSSWLWVITDQMQEGWVINWTDVVTLNCSLDRITTATPPPLPIVTPTTEPTPTSLPPAPTATPTETTPATPAPPAPTPTLPSFMGKVCQIKRDSDTSTIFLRQAELDALELPTGTKVTVTVGDTGRTFDNVTLGLDSELKICMVRLSKPYREALGVAGDTDINPPENRPDRSFGITQTLPRGKKATNFKGKVCQIKSGQDTNTVFLRLPEYNDFEVQAGATVNITVPETGGIAEDVTLGLDGGLATCAVRLSMPLRKALGVAGDTGIQPPERRPDRELFIQLP